MKKLRLTLFLWILLSVNIFAQSSSPLDTLGVVRFFSLTDGQLIAVPERYIIDRTERDGLTTLQLEGDTTFEITTSHIASESTDFDGKLPEMTSFKFNNKFNDQLFTDAIGEINPETGAVCVDATCIGKRLTPSFQLTNGASAYVDGIKQYSKHTRRRFDAPVTYTVAFPKQWIYMPRETKEAVWTQPEELNPDEQWICTPVKLSADMLSTNAWSNNNENPDKMIDGNTGTFYHSTWGSGAYEKLAWSEGSKYGDGKSEWPYVEIALPEPLHDFSFTYTTRQASGYALLGFIIQGSNDGKSWDDIRSFTAEADALPTGPDETFNSPVVSCQKAYSRLRLQLTASQRKNYLVISEFTLTKAEPNPAYGNDDFVPELISPAEYVWGFQPLGRSYTVDVRYLTDHSTAEYRVPTIRIVTSNGSNITSKTEYIDALFEIDGAGIYPDLKVEQMQIRGRGNSSWEQPWWGDPKNPYRLKFPEKIKPFGLTKGKNWVLLANKQSGSMTTNAIAMRIADMVQSAGANHIVPVELYINGQYRGSYNFTEKVGLANNSIALEDETDAVLLELDQYYDETYRFHDANYRLPVNIKQPEFDDPDCITSLTYDDIKRYFNAFTQSVQEKAAYHAYLDVDAFCRAMLVTDLTRNTECNHPKSFYLYNQNPAADSLWVFGPVWDFDWGYGYDGTSRYFQHSAESDLFTTHSGEEGAKFFKALLRGNEVIQRAYYRVWTEFLNAGCLDELIEFCDEYFEFAEPSFFHNATKWSDGNDYAKQTENAKQWLRKRADYIYSRLTPYELSDDELANYPEEEFGQPDRIDLTEALTRRVDVYTLSGVCVRRAVPLLRFSEGLAPGIYIVDGKKHLIR